MNVIGRNFDNAAANVEMPGYWSGDMGGELYVPDATPDMTDAELKTNYDALLYRISWWASEYSRSDSAEKANIDYMLSIWQEKKAVYESLMNKAAVTEPGTTPATTTNTGDATGEEKTNYLPFIIGGAAILFFYLKKRKKI